MPTQPVTVTSEFLRGLLGAQAPCISLYCPMSQSTGGGDEQRIRVKNLLNDAETQLEARGHRAPEASSMVAPLREAWSNVDSRRFESESWCAFASPGHFAEQRVPFACPPQMRVGENFHLTPLAPWMVEDRRFELLTLSQKLVRFYRGDRTEFERVEVAGLPDNMAEVIRLDETERQLQFHSSGPDGDAGKAGIFHGHGVHLDRKKDDIHTFCRRVAEALAVQRGDPHVPLIVAAVDYVYRIFREESVSPRVAEAFIHGNHDHRPDSWFHEQANQIVEDMIRARRKVDMDKLPLAVAHDQGSSKIAEILTAARAGRVATLFAAMDRELWGQVSEDGRVREDERPTANNEELVNRAVVDTLRNSGQLHVIAGEDMPNGAPVAAIYRY